MKKLIIFLLILCSYSVKAQLTDSSTLLIGGKSNTGWIRTTGFLPWQTNDSLTGKIVSGVYYVRAFFSSVIFTSQEAGIYADGTDQTARLNYVLSKSFVKGIKFSQNNGTSIVINGTVSAQGKPLIFDGSLYATGGGTLSKPTIQAPLTVQVFDSSITFADTVRTATGVFSLKWGGAVGNGVKDDLRALRAVTAVPNQNLVLPKGEYLFSDSLVVGSTNNLDGTDGVFVFTATDRPAIILGSPLWDYTYIDNSANKTHIIRLRRSTQSNWADSASPVSIGVLDRNRHGGFFKPLSIIGFTVNVQLVGHNEGYAYTDITFGRLSEAYIQVWATRVGTGWFNSNKLHNGWFTVSTGIQTGRRAWGFKLGTQGDSYSYNDNTWDGASFELNDTTRVPFWIVYGVSNTFYRFRTEGNSTQQALIQNTSSRNVFIAGYSTSSTRIVDTSSTGNNVYRDTRNEMFIAANSYSVFKWSAPGNTAAYNSTSSSVKGIGLYNSTGDPTLSVASSSLGIYPEFISIFTTGISAGVEFSTETTKSFLIKHTSEGTNYGRAFITMYASNGTQLSTKAPQMEALFPTYFPSTWGGGWLTGSNTNEDYYLGLPDSCARVKICFVGPTGNTLSLKSVDINAIGPNTNSVFPTFGNGYLKQDNLATEAPTSRGTYELGEKILNVNPTSVSSLYWVTYSAGTNRNLTAANGSITIGTDSLTVTGVSVDSIYVGEYISLSGIRYRVKRKSATKLYLYPNASATFSGAFNYYPATFTSIGGAESSLTGDL